MICPGDIFKAFFKILKVKGLITYNEYDLLIESMKEVTGKKFIETINRICEGD